MTKKKRILARSGGVPPYPEILRSLPLSQNDIREVLFMKVYASSAGGEVKDRPINAPDNEWAVLHPLRDKDKAAFRENVLLLFQPDFNFTA